MVLPEELRKKVKVGTSGYQFEDWFGTVYPPTLRQRNALEYYAQALCMDTVELNYTYYSLPSPSTSEAMAKRVPQGFEFAVRSHSSMTHEIWEGTDRKTIRDTAAAFERFVEGIMPLKEAGRLGPVLLQFPYGFFPKPVTYDYLRFCRQRLEGFDVIVEFRNMAWHRESVYNLLEELEMGYCVVDEPKIRGLLPLIPVATSKTGYVRLHGRNENWFGAGKDERYDYMYSEEELKAILCEVREVIGKTDRTYFFFNNCPRGQALMNAITFKKIAGLLKDFNGAQRFAISGGREKSGTGGNGV